LLQRLLLASEADPCGFSGVEIADDCHELLIAKVSTALERIDHVDAPQFPENRIVLLVAQQVNSRTRSAMV